MEFTNFMQLRRRCLQPCVFFLSALSWAAELMKLEKSELMKLEKLEKLKSVSHRSALTVE